MSREEYDFLEPGARARALGIFGPVIGAIMHEVAAVPVIANAATLIGWKSKKL